MNPEDYSDLTWIAAHLGYEALGATHLGSDRPGPKPEEIETSTYLTPTE